MSHSRKRPVAARRRRAPLLAGVAYAVGVVLFAITSAAPAHAQLQNRAASRTSAPRLSDHEIEALPSMSPEAQAELLMERAINHYHGALELIEKNTPSWYGHVQVDKGPLAGLLNTAI